MVAGLNSKAGGSTRSVVVSALVVLHAIAVSPATGDDVVFGFAKAFRGTNGEFGNGVAVDGSGNVLVTGQFVGTVDFDPGAGTANLVAQPFDDAFICKLNSSGNFVWAIRIGGANEDIGIDIAVDAAGNIYVTGSFIGTVDFNPGAGTANLTSAGLRDVFVLKLNSSGSFIWAVAMGGDENDAPSAITVDALGNVYTTGDFQDVADFNPGAGTANLTSAGMEDIFISKLNSSGGFVWARGFGSTEIDGGGGIDVDASGNVHTTGRFQGTIDFDPGAGTANLSSVAGLADVFVNKLNSSGNHVWAVAMGGSDTDFGSGLVLDPSGNVYTVGAFNSTADFDPGAGTANLDSEGATDIFVSKLNSSGAFVWAGAIGAFSFDLPFGIALDPLNGVHIAGKFVDAVDFDPGAGTAILTADVEDVFVSKLDSGGNFEWAKQMGGSDGEQANAIAVDALGNVYTTGYYFDDGDYDPGAGTATLTLLGVTDVFVSKLLSNVRWVDFAFAATENGSHPNPFNTLDEALDAVVNGGIVRIKGNTADSESSETLIINKSVRIEAISGTVRIGG